MAKQELSRSQMVYWLSGAALLLVISAVLYLTLTWNQDKVIVDGSRYDLTDAYKKQQFEQLVTANTTLQDGFNFDAATAQASALFGLGDYKEAEKAWKYFIANRPRAIQGYWGLGDIYTLWGRYEAAEKNWLMAIEVDAPATYANSYIKLADLYRTSLPEKRYKIVQIVNEAIAENPKEANYPLILASYYKDIGDKASAIRFYEEVLKLQPDAASANSIRNEINELKK